MILDSKLGNITFDNGAVLTPGMSREDIIKSKLMDYIDINKKADPYDDDLYFKPLTAGGYKIYMEAMFYNDMMGEIRITLDNMYNLGENFSSFSDPYSELGKIVAEQEDFINDILSSKEYHLLGTIKHFEWGCIRNCVDDRDYTAEIFIQYFLDKSIGTCNIGDDVLLFSMDEDDEEYE